MSFRCEFCGQPQAARARPVRVVTEVRERTIKLYDETPSYDGWEIAQEKNACESCAAEVPDKGKETRAFHAPPEIHVGAA